MTPEEAAAEVMKRETDAPGTFKPEAVARARQLLGQPPAGTEPGPTDRQGVTTLNEDLSPRERLLRWGSEGGLKGAAARGIDTLAGGADAFSNAALLGLPHAVERMALPNTRRGQQELAQAHPGAELVGEVAGFMAPGAPLGVAGSALGSAAKRAIPALGERYLGRAALAGAEGALGGGIGSAALTGAEGGDPLEAAKTGAMVGGIAGPVLQTALGEPARAAQAAIRRGIPDLRALEQGGGGTSILKGAAPGPELQAVEEAARSQKPRGIDPMDYLANRAVEPIMKANTEKMGKTAGKIASDVTAYGETPEGQELVPVDKILKAYTDMHAKNVAGEGGGPLAEAQLGPLRRQIANLADVHPAGDNPAEFMAQPGAERISRAEAARRGLPVPPVPQEPGYLSSENLVADISSEPGVFRPEVYGGTPLHSPSGSMPPTVPAAPITNADLTGREPYRTVKPAGPVTANPAGPTTVPAPRGPSASELGADWESALRRTDTRQLQGLAGEAGLPAGGAEGDVVVVPKRYNATELLQAIKNLENHIAQNPKDAQAKKLLSSFLEQRQSFQGLPELRAGHAEDLGDLTRQLGLANAPDRTDAFTKPQVEKALFQEVRGYGQPGRYEPQNEALRSLAGQAGQGRQLELIDALRALRALQGEGILPIHMTAGGAHLRLPAKAALLRADPLLESLGSARPAQTIGAETGTRRNDPIMELLGF